MKSRWSLIFVVFTMVGLLLGTAYWLVFASNTKFENEYSILFVETETSEEELLAQISPLLKS